MKLEKGFGGFDAFVDRVTVTDRAVRQQLKHREAESKSPMTSHVDVDVPYRDVTSGPGGSRAPALPHFADIPFQHDYDRVRSLHNWELHHFISPISTQSVRWLGMEVTLRHPERLESAEPFVIVANHQSALDVFTMTHCWPKNCVSLLKSSLKYIPGFNLCTYLCHAVYVDRFNRKEAKNSLVNVMDAIVNHKRKVFIYPEGSRHASPDEEFLPFKMGAFVIAKRANIPIVPVVFSSYQPFYDYTSSKFERNGHVVIEALEPIDSRDFETANELAAATRERMHETYKRLNAEMRKVGSTKAH
ncbi:hypothetical protein QR680_017523 [Steinernema hermaphroditum]|uniref:1-acyl-sn-glycerol-3-phosphate acyltransferase n=1 Tax=Steinernema hermaphroditum TaxID=289476 RepID=A0AA39LP65_9BILA|nr:hypothetical protein QR680_017523 [Steinernema hermaphroditum]